MLNANIPDNNNKNKTKTEMGAIFGLNYVHQGRAQDFGQEDKI